MHTLCGHVSLYVCASDRNDESLGCRVLSSFFHQSQSFLSLLQSLEVLSLISSVIFLAYPLSHHGIFVPPLPPCLHVFFSADVLTDRVIALEADAWTQDDIALYHELMHKLGRISGIHPDTSHLIIQGGEETYLWTY